MLSLYDYRTLSLLAQTSKFLVICGVVLMLGSPSCTTSKDPRTPAPPADIVQGPPQNVENACSIARDRPNWYSAARTASQKWNVPTATLLAIIWRESSFRPTARPPKKYAAGLVPWGRISSAYGFSQALDGTWDWYRKDTKSWQADRANFADAADFVGWYMNKTRSENGVPMSDATGHYLAYHEGHAGFRSGRWRKKPAVLRAARQVARKSVAYDSQLRSCDRSYALAMALASTPLPQGRPSARPVAASMRTEAPSLAEEGFELPSELGGPGGL